MISHWEGGRKFPAGWGGDARGEGKVEGRGSGKGGGRSRRREKKWSLGGTGSRGDDGAECRVSSFGSGTGGSSGCHDSMILFSFYAYLFPLLLYIVDIT